MCWQDRDHRGWLQGCVKHKALPAELQAERWWLRGVGAAAAESSSCRRCSRGKHLTAAGSKAWLQGRENPSWEERGRGSSHLCGVSGWLGRNVGNACAV